LSAPIKLIKSLPPSAQLTAIRMAAAGFPEGTWTYTQNHDLADMSKVVQVRDIKGPARKSKVDHYMTVMKPYATSLRDQLTMPPVVFTADSFLLDGNTRTTAASRLGWMTFPAFVLNFSYQNAAQAIVDQFVELAAVLNLSHGDNLDRVNTENIIARLANDDTTPYDLARRLGVSRTTVQNVLYARTARLRAERLKVDISAGHISRTHMADLGREDQRITDEVFMKFLELVSTGKMTSTEQRDFTRRIATETTEKAKLNLIQAELESRDRMRTGSATKPSPAAQLRQALGKVNSGDPGLMIETNPRSWETHRESLRLAIAQLEKTLNLQFQLELDGRTAGSQA